jgi:hypothetical protein
MRGAKWRQFSVTWRWLAVAGLGACGGAGSSGFNNADSGTTDADKGHPDSGAMHDAGRPHLVTDSGSMDTGGPIDATADAQGECPASATLIYVTGEDNHLWSFYPQALLYPDAGIGAAFTDIGPLTCLTGPTHMTVDREPSAWVVANGRIFKASTKDASCAAVPTWTPHPVAFSDFALTFVGVTSAIDNNLYLLSGSDLGLFDVAAGTVTSVGPPPLPGAFGDMTSDGDGTLYFLEDAAKLTLYNMDPTTGSVISKTPIPGATGGGTQALAFWGGSFFAFESNVIHQYDPKAMTTTSLGLAPLQVTGAGQSTCVPKVPPPPPPPPK